MPDCARLRKPGVIWKTRLMTKERSVFDPRLSIGNILTILAVLFAAAGTWYQLGERVTVIEHALAGQQAGVARLDRDLSRTEDQAIEIRERLRAIEATQGQQSSVLHRILRAVESQ